MVYLYRKLLRHLERPIDIFTNIFDSNDVIKILSLIFVILSIKSLLKNKFLYIYIYILFIILFI